MDEISRNVAALPERSKERPSERDQATEIRSTPAAAAHLRAYGERVPSRLISAGEAPRNDR
jgi:hypothetical protein